MAIGIVCSGCGRTLRVPDEYRGKKVRCQACRVVTRARHVPELDRAKAGLAASPHAEAARESRRDGAVGCGRRPETAPAARRQSAAPDEGPGRISPVEFNAVVKHDPYGALKGVLRVRLGPDGLRLRKTGDFDLLLPPGTPARHLVRNKFVVEVDEREVTLAVHRFVLYKARLARDAVALLSGRAGSLDPRGYRLEWYLLAPSFLPLGIPLLALAAAVPALGAGQFSGGANARVVLALGAALLTVCGFGLAGVCLQLAQAEHLGNPAKAAVSLGLNVAAYLGVALLFWVTDLSRAGGPGNGPPPGAAPNLVQQLPLPTKLESEPAREKLEAATVAPEPTGQRPPPEETREPFPARVLRIPGSKYQYARFSPDGRTLLTSGDGNVARLWDHVRGTEIRSFSGKLADFAANGRQVVYYNGRFIGVRQSDGEGELPLRFEGDRFVVTPDGRRLVTFQDGVGTLRSYDLTTGAAEATWNVGQCGKGVCGLALSPDGTAVAVSYAEDVLVVHELATGAVRADCQGGPVDGFDRPEFSPDGKLVACSAKGANITALFDAASGRLRKSYPDPAAGALAFSPDGKWLASGSRAGEVALYDREKEQRSAVLHVVPGAVPLEAGTRFAINNLTFSTDGRYLAAACSDVVKVWDVGTLVGAPVRPAASPQTAPLANAVRPSAPASAPARPAPANEGPRDLPPSKADVEVKLPGGYQSSGISFSPDGKTLALAVRTGVSLWDVVARREQAHIRVDDAATFSVDFSGDGKTLLTCGVKGTVRLWDVSQRRELHSFPAPGGPPVRCARLSRDGRTAAACAKAIRLWDVQRGVARDAPGGDGTLFTAVAFSPNGKLVAGGDGRTVHLWDAASLRTVKTFDPGGRVLALAFSPDGSVLVSGGIGAGVKLWDVTTGEAKGTYAQSPPVWSLAFSPDGKLLLSAGRNELKVWDAATGQTRGELLGPSGGSVGAVSPDGRLAASVGMDGTLRMWDLTKLAAGNVQH